MGEKPCNLDDYQESLKYVKHGLNVVKRIMKRVYPAAVIVESNWDDDLIFTFKHWKTDDDRYDGVGKIVIKGQYTHVVPTFNQTVLRGWQIATRDGKGKLHWRSVSVDHWQSGDLEMRLEKKLALIYLKAKQIQDDYKEQLAAEKKRTDTINDIHQNCPKCAVVDSDKGVKLIFWCDDVVAKKIVGFAKGVLEKEDDKS